MIHISSKTAAILAAFTAVSAPLMLTGCGQENQQQQGEALTDDQGRTYHLIKNADGTETARYDNGEEVTFRRDEDNNLNYVSGMSSLLPMMLASYFLFHGIGGYSGHYDRNTGNVLNNKPAYQQQQQQPNAGGAGANAANNKSGTYQQGTAGNNGKSTVTAPAGGKTGFGSAGVRSGGAS